MGRVGDAFELAFAAHQGQTDKSGQPYMAHVVRVASRVDTEDAQIVALLHDVVEDTDVTLATVEDTFGLTISAAVDAITKRKGEANTAYLDRVSANSLARDVKLSDLADNSDPVRLSLLDDATRARLTEKYARARDHLTGRGEQAISICLATVADRAKIDALYPLAFPDEDLLPLLGATWSSDAPPLMLVAERDGQVVGHAAFSPCHVEGTEVSLLGPLAVHPDHQRQRLGTALIREGLQRLGQTTLVLGDPAYYGRHGFTLERGILPSYLLPQEWADAWQSVAPEGTQPLTGTLSVPDYWQDPALWGA